MVRAISESVGLRRESSLAPSEIPLWLAKLHGSLPIGDRVKFTLVGDLPVPLDLLLEGAGFELDNGLLIRLEALPDIVSADMKFLVCGLNPSPHATETGVGFSRPGNRFWPAALQSGLATIDRDPQRALANHGVGFTDLVKRPTRRAEELSAAEFRAGVARVERLTSWLDPMVVIMVGLTGWRQATGTNVPAGWQPRALGGLPVYLMPSTSGLNAHETQDSLAKHLKSAQGVPPLLDLAG
jgi:TDG/mug DNA glycosylase family protein